MGYDAKYTLKTLNAVNVKEFIKKIEEIDIGCYFEDDLEDLQLGNTDVDDAVCLSSDGGFSWGDEDEDMLDLSLTFPDTVFELTGEGCEGDFWRTYYKNGKKQDAGGKIVYDKYDESKLK